jgi:hypothetical protein
MFVASSGRACLVLHLPRRGQCPAQAARVVAVTDSGPVTHRLALPVPELDDWLASGRVA